jgi:Secretion system C-terminal sorting domain
MKRNLLFLGLFITAVCARAQFSAGNLVVSKIKISGTQSAINNSDTGNGYVAELQEITPAGVNVGAAIALPSLVLDGRSVAYEGGLGLSQDGKSLSIVGFSGGVNTNSGTFRALSKIIYRIDSQKNLGIATNILSSDWAANGYRSVVSKDGSSFIVSTGGGGAPAARTINYGANNPTGSVVMTPWSGTVSGGVRNMTFSGAEKGLYACYSGGIINYTDAGVVIGTNPMSGATGDVTQVVVFDLQPSFGDANGNDVMYAANRNSGVTKYTWSGSSWVAGTSLNGESVTPALSPLPGSGVYSIVGRLEGGKPTLYAISHNGNSTGATFTHSQLLKFVDNTAYNVDWSYPGSVISILASTNTATDMFRSVSFVPQGTLSAPSFEKKAQSWSMYPNPSKGSFTIDSEVSGNFNIYNVLGQKVHQFKVENGSNSVNVDRLNSGTYFVEGLNTTQKLLIQK